MASFLLPRKKYTYYNEGGFLKMEINKIISISCGTAVAGIMAVTGVLLYKNKKKKEKADLNATLKILEIREDVHDIALDACTKRISKLNERIDSLEKSNKK